MAYVQKPGTGALWVNDRKTEDKHPDRTGTLVMPNGEEYFIDGWLKETKPDADGKTKKFLSLSVKLKNKQGGQQPPAQRPGAPAARPGREGLPTRPAPRPAHRSGLPPPPKDPDIDPDAGIGPDSPDIPF